MIKFHEIEHLLIRGKRIDAFFKLTRKLFSFFFIATGRKNLSNLLLAVRAITILRPSYESVNVLKDWKECIRLAVKSIFTTESLICEISRRRLGKHSSPNEIAPRRFLLRMLYKRSRKRTLQFSLSWTQFNWLLLRC